MLRQGASVAEVGEVLRHRSPNANPRYLGQRERGESLDQKQRPCEIEIDLANRNTFTARQIAWTHKFFPQRFLLS
jgi:hypothetical protein